MNNEHTAEWAFSTPVAHSKGTPTLGQELLSVLRFIFDQPERRLSATDFVWSYQELSDDIPD
jgi:hypothetical protein